MCLQIFLSAVATAATTTDVLLKDENLSHEFPEHLPLSGDCIILLESHCSDV